MSGLGNLLDRSCGSSPAQVRLAPARKRVLRGARVTVAATLVSTKMQAVLLSPEITSSWEASTVYERKTQRPGAPVPPGSDGSRACVGRI